jgi:hypothetical protein
MDVTSDFNRSEVVRVTRSIPLLTATDVSALAAAGRQVHGIFLVNGSRLGTSACGGRLKPGGSAVGAVLSVPP